MSACPVNSWKSEFRNSTPGWRNRAHATFSAEMSKPTLRAPAGAGKAASNSPVAHPISTTLEYSTPRGIAASAHFADHVFASAPPRPVKVKHRKDLDAALTAAQVDKVQSVVRVFRRLIGRSSVSWRAWTRVGSGWWR